MFINIKILLFEVAGYLSLIFCMLVKKLIDIARNKHRGRLTCRITGVFFRGICINLICRRKLKSLK